MFADSISDFPTGFVLFGKVLKFIWALGLEPLIVWNIDALRKEQLATEDMSVQSLSETFYCVGSIGELGKAGV